MMTLLLGTAENRLSVAKKYFPKLILKEKRYHACMYG